MRRPRALLLSASRILPSALIRRLGRQHGHLSALFDRLARAASHGSVEIQRGPGAGLLFDAGPGGRVGFVLGTWEPKVQEILPKLVRQGDVVWDVGAATGFYVLIASRLVGDQGHVVAFEPFAANLVCLRRNVQLNGLSNVTILETAVGVSAGRAVMVPVTTDEVSIDMQLVDDDAVGSVPVVRLDDVSEEIPPPSLIMMDIEGVEFDALQGARKLIARTKPTLLIEVHERWEELNRLLGEIGYIATGIEIDDPFRATEPVHVVARPVARSR